MIDDKPMTIQFHDVQLCSCLMVQPQPEAPQMGYPGVPPRLRLPSILPLSAMGDRMSDLFS